jgi:hypothetical protein
MADRSVVLRFLSDTTGLKKGFAEAGQGAQNTEGVFAKLEGKLSGISSSGVAAAAGMAGVATSVVAFATEAVKRLGEEQVAAAQTAAAIMSTGGAAQVSAVHVHTMADSLAKLSGVDDEVVQGGENLLLTFTNIKNGVGAGNDVFDQATKAALNMSVALGEDLQAASMQVGKALQDPIAGVTALRRVGVLLTDQQKASIGAFVASGDVMSAQKVILAELTKEFGGSAEAYGKTLPGAIGKAKTAIENWSASVAKDAMPAVQSFAGGVADVAKAVGPPLLSALEKAGGVVTTVGGFLKDHKGFVIAAAGAYTLSLVPAIWTSVAAFAALNFEKVTVTIGLMIGKVVELAAEMGVLNLALAATGVGAAVIGFGALATELMNNKKHADEFKASLSAGLDLKTGDGLVAEAKRISDALAANEAQYKSFGGTAKRVLGGIGEGFNPTAPNVIADNVANHKTLLAAQDQALASLKQYNQNVGTSSQQLGISTDAVKALAAANQIDLTGALDDTTGKLHDVYAAQVAATKGWTGYGVSVEEAVQIQKDVTAAFEAAADPIKVYAAALTAAQDASKTGAKASADSVREQAKAQRDALDARHTAEKAALDGEFITGKASKAAHDQRVKNLDAQQAAENKAADATVAAEDKRATAIENTKVQTGLSMAEYQKSVAANTKSTLAWMTNLALVGTRPGGAAVEGMLAQLGPAQAGLVAQVAASSGHAFDSFAATMAAAGKTATDETALELNKLPGEVQTVAQTSGQVFATTLVAQVALGLKPLSAIVALAAADALNNAFTAMQGQATADAAALHDKNEGAAASREGIGLPTGPTVPVLPTTQGSYQLGQFGMPVHPHAEGHFAQVAPAGAWRVWAEPETGGEAYIPLAASKRAGSMALVAQVANAFGARVVPMATGGTWGVPVGGGGGGVGGYGSSIASLERAVATLEKTSSQRRTVQVNNTFNEKADPLHIAHQIAWQLK